MTAAGLPVRPEWIAEGDYTREGGYRAARLLLERKPCPTAIVCASDMMALGVLDAAWELGMKVPDELAVVGFDDIFIASLRSVSLTTVRFDREGLAELAIRDLFNQASGKARHEPPQYVTLPCRLIVRRSCGSTAPNGAEMVKADWPLGEPETVSDPAQSLFNDDISV
jgi:LacI family transcriptional regulator